jgi:hypothetical protein
VVEGTGAAGLGGAVVGVVAPGAVGRVTVDEGAVVGGDEVVVVEAGAEVVVVAASPPVAATAG